MADYPYEGQLIADPVTFQRAVNAQVYVYDAADTANATPLALKDATGLPLTNPLTSSADAFTRPFYATSQDIKLVGAGLTVFVSSAKGMRDAATSAATAAQTAADSASTAAGNTVASAAVDSAGNLVIQKASGATVNAGSVKGAKGDKGDKGNDGSNVLPTDDAIEAAILGSGTKTKAALSATYADYPTLQSVSTTVAQVGESRRAHGGKIGTSGKGVVAFRIDHYIDAYRATVWPLMKARGFPAGLGIISRPNNPVDPTTSTWAQVKQLVNEGNEVWSHTATHTDPGNDPAKIIDEIVTSKQDLEAQGFKVHGFQMAGTATTNPNFGSNFTTLEDFNSPVGRLLLSNYGLIECYAGGSRRLLPTDGCYGLDHVTIESLTLTQLKATVDEVTRYGYGIEFMIHSNRIGAPGYLSLADFTAFLDYIKAAWDTGTLEVLSPSGLAWADPNSDRKTELLTDMSFEGVAAPSSAGPIWFMQGGSGVTIGTDGGKTGSKYARFSPASGYAFMLQGNTKVQQLGLNGTAMIAEGWARAPLGAANARMFVVDNNDNTRINLDVNWALTAGQTWTRFRIPFVCPVGTTNLAIKVSRFSGDTIDWDDVRAYVV